MKIQQVSVFLENKPGALRQPCRLLAEAGIDIRTLTLADTRSFGILRMIVSDWQGAEHILRESGYVTNITEVVAVEVPDQPGGLDQLLSILQDSGVNIEYMYAFTSGREGKAVLIFRFDHPDRAISLLHGSGINVVGSVEVYNRITT